MLPYRVLITLRNLLLGLKHNHQAVGVWKTLSVKFVKNATHGTDEVRPQSIGLQTAIQPAKNNDPAEGSLHDLFLAIDRMPRKRLTKKEIDEQIAEERSSWD
jgi:hypothetical protein